MPSMKGQESTILWQMDSGIQSGATTGTHSVRSSVKEMDNCPNGQLNRQPDANLSNLPNMKGQESTVLWQMDSGIQSGATTGAHSVRSGVEEMDNGSDMAMSYDWVNSAAPASNYNNSTIADEMVEEMGQQMAQSSEQAPRMSIFDQGLELPSNQIEANHAPAVQSSNEPSQMLKASVSDCLSWIHYYQNDSDLATGAIPELIKLLNDEDQVVVAQAAMVVHQLSRKEVSRCAIINSPQMIAALIRSITQMGDSETTKFAAGVIHNLSQHPQGLLAIFKSQGIPALIKLLNSPVESVLYYAITSLHNLLLHQEGSKAAIRAAGGIEKMVVLLRRDNIKFLAIVTDCLQILAYGNQEAKFTILATNGPVELIRIMRQFTYEKLLWTTSRVLKVLSVCSSNKQAIVQNGGMQALAMHLTSTSHRLVLNCLWTLRNLSDAATRQNNLEELLRSLVYLLSNEDLQLVTCSLGILSNLTCNNQNNKLTVTKLEGIEALIRAIRRAGDREEITEPAVCALRHLTCRYEQASVAQNLVRFNYGIPVIVDLLNQSRWPLVKAVVGLIRNLALHPPNQESLRENNAIPKIVALIRKAYAERQKTSNASVGGVKMEDIIDGTVSALQIMAKDEQNRIQIREQKVIPMLINLLYLSNENILKADIGLLCELALDKEGADAIKIEGAIQPLTNLMSRNDAIAAYAAQVISSLQKPKGGKKRISAEINQNFILTEGNGNWPSTGGEMDLATLMTDDHFQEMFHGSGGPPSVHSASSHHNPYSNNYDPNGMDPLTPIGPSNPSGGNIFGQIHDPSMDLAHEAMDFDHSMEANIGHATVPTTPQANVQPWYGSDFNRA